MSGPNRMKISNSSAQELGGSPKFAQIPTLSQRQLTTPLQPVPVNSRLGSPLRHTNSILSQPQVAVMSSGSTPSLYRPISSHHHSRVDIGFQQRHTPVIPSAVARGASNPQGDFDLPAERHEPVHPNFSAGRLVVTQHT